MLYFPTPIPVVVETDKEGYAIYVESGGTFENDIWCVVHCDGGIVRHYRTDQIRIHSSGTFGHTRDRFSVRKEDDKDVAIQTQEAPRR